MHTLKAQTKQNSNEGENGGVKGTYRYIEYVHELFITPSEKNYLVKTDHSKCVGVLTQARAISIKNVGCAKRGQPETSFKILEI